MKITNIFGSCEVYYINDIKGPIKIECSACMSVYADAYSWAVSHMHRIGDGNSIIILGCQVTDISILNVFKRAVECLKTYENVYISGCLAHRFDIPFPAGVKRLMPFSSDTYIGSISENIISINDPFWINPADYNPQGVMTPGRIFRGVNAVRLSRGCDGHCSYCTIIHTRGDRKEFPLSYDVFAENDELLLIADSPSIRSLSAATDYACRHNTKLQMRNLEPIMLGTGSPLRHHFETLLDRNLLSVMHAPLQSLNPTIITHMRRSLSHTEDAFSYMQYLRSRGVKIATNLIIDYPIDGTIIEDDTLSKITPLFDYVSWNPLWDNVWDEARAIERDKRYFPWR